jgi:4-amino-4-deoxy-L-arabinose transferase-like glycosyltransferase
LDLEIFGIFGLIAPFRDYVVVFEGGYRMLLGQIQYLDFYFPTGPIVFLIQAFSQFIFGSNLYAMAAQSFILAVVLCIIFYFILRKEFGWIVSFIFALFFYVSFNGLTFQPWYDHVAYFFFFLNIFLLIKYYKKSSLPKFVYLLSAFLVTLSFYSKQDVGLLQAVFILSYFLFNYFKDLKITLKYFLFPLIFLSGAVFFIFSLFTDISYWFNLGQPPHSARFSHIFITIKSFNVITSWRLYASLFLIYKVLSNKVFNKNIIPTR